MTGDDDSEPTLARRQILATLGATGAFLTSVGIKSGRRPPQVETGPDGTNDPQSDTDGTNATHTPRAQTETPRSDSPDGSGNTQAADADGIERVEEYGAAVDGRTDDTAAVMQAIEAAAPDGTVRFPPGRVLIDGKDRNGTAITLAGETNGVTLRGAGPGPTGTTLVLDAAHPSVHRGILIRGETDAPATATVENLALEGSELEQNYRVGLGIEVVGEGKQDVTIEKLFVRNWAVGGLKANVGGVTVRNSTFYHNGHRARKDGFNGHGITSEIVDNEGRTVAENVLCTKNTGNSVDNGGGKLTIRNSVIKDNRHAIKVNEPTEEVRIENCRIANHEEMAIHNIPQDRTIGRLSVENTLIDGAAWPGFYCPAGGVFEGDNIVVRRTNLGTDRRGGVVFLDDERTIDVGTMSVHETGGGGAVYFENCTGSIDKLVHGDNSGGLGDTGEVDIETTASESPLDIIVPTAGDVGALTYSSP